MCELRTEISPGVSATRAIAITDRRERERDALEGTALGGAVAPARGSVADRVSGTVAGRSGPSCALRGRAGTHVRHGALSRVVRRLRRSPVRPGGDRGPPRVASTRTR